MAHQYDFFTVGYSGKTIEEFVGRLQSAGVRLLMDIRFTPISMYKPAFSKTNLQESLAKSGIDYLHLRDLGVPKDIRSVADHLQSRDFIWDWYDEHVVARGAGSNLD